MKDLPLDSTDLTWLSRLARALLGESHAADDLVQETLVAAMEHPLPPEAPRRAWLRSVARRLAARRFRGESRRTQREAHVAKPEALADSTELVERAEIAERVTAAARALPEPYRRTVLLRFLEGRTPEEIATDEAKPVDTIRWRLRRGLELLREELVRGEGRDWSSWSVLLIPLARSGAPTGATTAGAGGMLLGTLAAGSLMKLSLPLVVAAIALGLWFDWGGDEPTREALEPTAALAIDPPASSPTQGEDLRRPAVAQRTEETAPGTARTEPRPQEPLPPLFYGVVVDEQGAAVEGATVYQVPARIETPKGRPQNPVLARTQSGADGGFSFAVEREADAPATPTLRHLGVAANGFLRRLLPDAVAASPAGGHRIVLERGRVLEGRVVDTEGRPVAGLDLVAHIAHAGIGHVSPSQRQLRSERAVLADLGSKYQQSLARTDARGEIRFEGLPEGNLVVTTFEAGWTVEAPYQVEADGTYIVWTVKQRLGVRLDVREGPGRPRVQNAEATFRVLLELASGETRDEGQWVGHGRGIVSFAMDFDGYEPLEGETIVAATFYGTAGDGERTANWRAVPLRLPRAGDRVAEVRVTLPAAPEPPSTAASTEQLTPAVRPWATLELDASFADGAPCQGDLIVRWSSSAEGAPTLSGSDRPEALPSGRYRLKVPAGQLALEVAEYGASGSLSPWAGELEALPDTVATALVTLTRGGLAILSRPAGWSGEWYVHASFRGSSDEDWRGSWGYSTRGDELRLPSLRNAEWRFQLREEPDEEPAFIHTVEVRPGQRVLVGENRR